LEKKWDCVILDESTKIRNPKAKITKLIQAYAGEFKYKAVLTGLPDPESPLDFFEQMRFLHGRFLGCSNYWSFKRCHFFQIGYTDITPKRTKVRIKAALQQLAFSMTRKQAGINISKVYEKRYVPLNNKQKKLYKQIEEGFEYKIGKEEQQTKWVPVRYSWYSAISGGFTPEGKFLSDAKLKEIVNLLKGELKYQQVVIWFRFSKEIEYVAKALNALKYKVGIFTGAEKDDAEKFEKKHIQIICAQGKCGQYGLDWSCASTAIYYSNWYDGEIRQQSEDRIVHPQKKEPLLYIDLVAEDSIDEDVVAILRRKNLNAKEFAVELQERWKKRLDA
jgi:SNF2 family DNA or RNA helicase